MAATLQPSAVKGPLDDIIAGIDSLGDDYGFLPDTFEIRKNDHGVTGFFAKRDLESGVAFLTLPIRGGSLTPLRAYEEARELLGRIGRDRFHLDKIFIMGAALYLRYQNRGENPRDPISMTLDLADGNAPAATKISQVDLYHLLDCNDQRALAKARNIERWIEEMGVDAALFRSAIGYVGSRAWDAHGVVPVFDLFNSSYGALANSTFATAGDEMKMILTRDVKAGEEITWPYNQSDAAETWFSYGYLDRHRPCAAGLSFQWSDAERATFEDFAHDHFGVERFHISSDFKENKGKFRFVLPTPGAAPNRSDREMAVIAALDAFIEVRLWFRMIALKDSGEPVERITREDLRSFDLAYDPEIEILAIDLMKTALTEDRAGALARIDAFMAAKGPGDADLTVYRDLVNDASEVWERNLGLIAAVLKTEGRADRLEVLRAALSLSAESEADLRAEIEDSLVHKPDLALTLVRKYWPAFFASRETSGSVVSLRGDAIAC